MKNSYEKYNFLFYLPIEGFGGLEIQTLMRAMDAKNLGYDSLAIVKENTRSYEFCLQKTIEFCTFNQRFKYFDPSSIIKLRNLIIEKKIDIIIVPKTHLLLNVIIARKLSNQRCSIILYQQMQSGIIKKDPFHNFIYKNLNGGIVLTNIMKEQLATTTIMDINKITVVPYGIKIEDFNFELSKVEIRKKFGLPESGFIIGNVARIEEKKDQLTILKAFEKLEIPNKYFVLCGNIDDAEYFNLLQQFISSRNLSDKFKYIAFTDEVSKLMNSLDLFILSTPSETFGLVILEAMASRVPVIATNCDGIKEIINVGNNGILFEARNYEQLSEYINKIYYSIELNNCIVNNAYINIVENYSYSSQSELFFHNCINFHNRI